MDCEHNPVIVSNDDVDWNNVFNEIKPNLKDSGYENSLNNPIYYLIKLL